MDSNKSEQRSSSRRSFIRYAALTAATPVLSEASFANAQQAPQPQYNNATVSGAPDGEGKYTLKVIAEYHLTGDQMSIGRILSALAVGESIHTIVDSRRPFETKATLTADQLKRAGC